MRFVCALYALSMRFLCAFDALSMRFRCAFDALSMRFLCAFYALCVRFVCACMRLYTLVRACMRFVCARMRLYALCMRFVCALSALCMCFVWARQSWSLRASPRRRNTFKLRAARHGAVCLIFHIPSVMGWAWMYVKMGCFSVLLKPSYLEKVRKRRNVKLPR